MSEESTTPDRVERWQQAAEAGDRRDFDAVMSIFVPDAVWELQPLGISLEGVTAIRSFLEDWLGNYVEYQSGREKGQDLGTESCL
jgi:ketosteroid isomerase-like protein